MDSSSTKLVNTVKAGKAKAELRRRRTSQLNTLMHLIEACVVLVILLSWCSGSSLSLAFHHSLRLLDQFRKPLPVFLLSNGIIIVIAFLSGTGDRKPKTETSTDFSDRIYDEYLSRRGITQVATLDIPVAKKPTEEISDNKLQIVPYVLEPKPSELVQSKVSRASPTPKVASRVLSSAPAVMTAKEGERHYRRMRSAVVVKSCKQENDQALRRSMTENARGMARSCREPARQSVDDLSNDEFNQTVENYIARTRRFLQTELMADLPMAVSKENHTNNSNMAVVVRN